MSAKCAKTPEGRKALKAAGNTVGPPKGDLSTHKAAPKSDKKKKAEEPEVTHLDMSKPDEPESEFPTISKKGGM